MITFVIHTVHVHGEVRRYTPGHLLAINYSERWPWSANVICECGGKTGTLGWQKLAGDIEPWSTVHEGCNPV